MKRTFCFLIIVFACLNILPAQTYNQWITDPERDEKVLVGYGDREGLLLGTFNTYYETEYKAYILNDTVCSYLKNNIADIEITMVLGTWCHDSQEQVPRFFKILDNINFNPDKFTLIGVDREKLGGEADLSGMDIQKVPTFIFFREGKELGRIIETPMNTLEEDMMFLIRYP